MATRTVRDVIGSPESWPSYRFGGNRMPNLRGAKIRSVRLADPDEIHLTIEIHGLIYTSSFDLVDRDLRLRVHALLKPGSDLAACLDQAL